MWTGIFLKTVLVWTRIFFYTDKKDAFSKISGYVWTGPYCLCCSSSTRLRVKLHIAAIPSFFSHNNKDLNSKCSYYSKCTSGRFRGCSWGQLRPFHDGNLAWRPIFGNKGAPYPDPNVLFFSCFVLNVGNI